MDLWKNYKATVAKIFPDVEFVKRHAEWTNKKGVNLTADLYSGEHLIKSRQVEIWDDKSCSIHNNIISLRQDLIYPVLVWISWE